LSASLANIHGVLEENRKPLHSTITHLDDASAKFAPLLDDLKKTNADAQKAINTLEGTISENRTDLRQSVEELRRVLDTANNVTDQLDRTLNANGENIDDILNNFRQAFAKLRQFTETLKPTSVHVAALVVATAACTGKSSEAGLREIGMKRLFTLSILTICIAAGCATAALRVTTI